MPVFHFSSDRAMLENEGLKKYNKQAAYCCHTNINRSLLAVLRCHASSNMYAENEMPHW